MEWLGINLIRTSVGMMVLQVPSAILWFVLLVSGIATPDLLYTAGDIVTETLVPVFVILISWMVGDPALRLLKAVMEK